MFRCSCRSAAAALAASATVLATGCSAVADLSYEAGLAKQEDQCRRLPDIGDMRACLAKVGDDRSKARAARRTDTPDNAAAGKRSGDLCFTRASTGERVCPN